VLGGLNILVGYLGAWLSKAPRYDDPQFRRHLHAWQLRELRERFLGKQGTTAPAEHPPAR
jgi:hypothetical protein